MEDALHAAKTSFDSGIWSKSDVRDRANVLNKAAGELSKRVKEFAELESLQTGR